MLNADWLGAPRLRTSHTIGARGIKTWPAFGAPSHFLKKSKTQENKNKANTVLTHSRSSFSRHQYGV